MKGFPPVTITDRQPQIMSTTGFCVCGDVSTGGGGGRYTILLQCPHSSKVEKLYRFTSF